MAIERDTTERIQHAQALQESERFARSTVDALSAHLAILDESGKIIAVNRAWRQFASDNQELKSNVCVTVHGSNRIHGANWPLRLASTASQSHW